MNASQAREYFLSKPEAAEDFPFGDDVMVFKVLGKMFGLLSEAGGKNPNSRAQMNLKCEPEEAIQLRDIFDDVIPGYHMNKRHWNTVYLTDENNISDVPQGEIERMIDNSYALVLKGMTKAQRRALEVQFSHKELYGAD